MERLKDDFLWNVSIAEQCAHTHFLFPRQFPIWKFSDFCHYPRMQIAKDPGCGLICVCLSGWWDLRHCEVFPVLECTTIEPVADSLAVSQFGVIDKYVS